MAEQFTAEYDAMRRALALAASPGVPTWPNPRVGCVLLSADGTVVAEGYHRGAGNPHAEVEALRAAGAAARGTTAVVTLEPCNHTGRTGPCSQALIEAGVARVVVAQRDPNPVAQGGLDTLAAAGIAVDAGLLAEDAEALNRAWSFAHRVGRPFVTWKLATTLDGRSAARDGSSRWVTSTAARRDTHALRALCDTMLVGSNTVAVDDPQLTVRDADGTPLPRQPLRVVMGNRDLPPDRRIFDDAAETVHLRTHDPLAALGTLYRDHGRHHVFFEGGPTLAAAFLKEGVVDEVVAYVAPLLLGGGKSAVGNLGIRTITKARRLDLVDTLVLLPAADDEDDDINLRLTLRPRKED